MYPSPRPDPSLRRGRRAAAFLLAFALAAAASANPFLGEEDEAAPAPVAATAPPPALSKLQFAFRDRLASAISTFKEKPSAAAVGALLAGAFVYGLLHAAGPGHRKTVVFSLFMARRAKAWEPAAAGLVAAGAHAGTAVALILVLGALRGAIAELGALDKAVLYLDGFTLAALGLVAMALAARKAIDLARGRGHDHGTRGSGGEGAEDGGRGLYAIVAASSLVPCPGATMVLLFALYLDLAVLGLAAVLAMSAGMAAVTAAAGYLAFFGREGLFLRMKDGGKAVEAAASVMELGSYLFLAAFSTWAAWPFLASLFAGA